MFYLQKIISMLIVSVLVYTSNFACEKSSQQFSDNLGFFFSVVKLQTLKPSPSGWTLHACYLFWKLQFLWLMNRLWSDNLALCCAFLGIFCNFVWCYKLISRTRSHKDGIKETNHRVLSPFLSASVLLVTLIEWIPEWIRVFIMILQSSS